MTPYPTLAEAAEALHLKSERVLREWLRKHPQDARGRPYVRGCGHARIMTWDDVARVKTALAQEAEAKKRAVKEAVGYVYFIDGGEWIKIGYTRSAEHRLKKMLTDAPVELKILHIESGTFRTEKMLHRQFAACRARGEWFRKTDELLAFIDQRKLVAQLSKGA